MTIDGESKDIAASSIQLGAVRIKNVLIVNVHWPKNTKERGKRKTLGRLQMQILIQATVHFVF